MKRFSIPVFGLLLLFQNCTAQHKVAKVDLSPTPASERLSGFAQSKKLEAESLVKNVEFRCVGPTVMSGRVVDVDVDPNDPTHFYVAYASGGLWETRNNGTSFEPLFDHEAVMTIGDIAVDWWDEGTIWVGTGENNSSRSSYSGVGIYKSEDHGKTWNHMGLDESHHIGRIVLNPFDTNTMWVAVLGHLYTPNKERGIYKTTDGGDSWIQVLSVSENAGGIDLVMDPLNASELYAAIWERSRASWSFEESGKFSSIYRSTDGGNSWKKMMDGFPASEGIGRVGLAIHNSTKGKFLYAVLDNQNHREKKEEDIKEEELRKSKGDLDKKDFKAMSKDDFAKLDDKKLESFLSDNDFPKENTAESVKRDVAAGKLEPVALYDYLYDANSDLFDTPVIGAEVYRYDFDAMSWKRTHEDYLDGLVYTYGYYFGQIRVSPADPEKIYIMGVPLITSDDGGKIFRGINPGNVHGDHHALWIDQDNPKHLVNGSDGGVQISYDDGATWVNCNTPAVGQFYTVAVDNDKPYNVYGGLQDNGVWVGSSTNEPNRDWYATGRYPYDFLYGGDGMQVQVDSRDNQTIYTGYQFGWYGRLNRKDGFEKDIHPMHKLGEKPLRWNWQTPILLSKHQQDIFYICSNKVHRSLDQGATFETMSSDLTQGGKPGDVPYGTLTTIAESPLQFGLLAVGSDDGLVHISKDNGYNWEKISAALPQNLWVSRVIFSAHKKERMFVALNGYRFDHFTPYIYVSDDLGKTWKSISSDLPPETVNVMREDFSDEKILYAGTDHGLYITLDRGNTWMSFAGNMPNAPVHDIALQQREKDIVLGTHGRSIWIGDLEEVQQLNTVRDSALYVFEIPKVDFSRGWGGNTWWESEEPEVKIPVYINANSTGAVVDVLYNDSLMLKGFDTMRLPKGINYLSYDLTIGDDVVKALEDELNKKRKEDEREIKIEKADNGKFYLPKGKYTVSVLVNGVGRKGEMVVE